MKRQDKLVADLYVDMLALLGERIKDKDIGATEMKLIRDIAKDHDVQVDKTRPGNPLDEAFGELPFDEYGQPTEAINDFY